MCLQTFKNQNKIKNEQYEDYKDFRFTVHSLWFDWRSTTTLLPRLKKVVRWTYGLDTHSGRVLGRARVHSSPTENSVEFRSKSQVNEKLSS